MQMNKTHDIKVSPEREYVIVCNEHSGIWSGCVLFWGSLTDDGAERRSFGGYTTGVDLCERYTLEEARSFSQDFVLYEPGMSYQEFRSHRDVIIKPEQLAGLGLRTMQIWYRP